MVSNIHLRSPEEDSDALYSCIQAMGVGRDGPELCNLGYSPQNEKSMPPQVKFFGEFVYQHCPGQVLETLL